MKEAGMTDGAQHCMRQERMNEPDAELKRMGFGFSGGPQEPIAMVDSARKGVSSQPVERLKHGHAWGSK